MVKAEPEHDFYAELELQPSATANDVKKQFKKLALQYHPDRNPSGDTTAKFQAIQSANEILTDPQQRAKYDAQRMRSGFHNTYADAPMPTTRNNTSRSTGFSNFPPPPRPPPATTKKSTFSTTASGAQKYARFSTPDPASWRTKDPDDAKSKTNDLKAWEHMRHGQGPIPRGRKETKPTAFQPGRERQGYSGQDGGNTAQKRTSQRRNDWEHLPDAGMPNIHRSNTTRTPSKPFAYAPATPGPGNDETQARSAYFNVSRERPVPSRAQTNMPPPPPPRAPTAKKTEPIPILRGSKGTGDIFTSGLQRPHTSYPTVHGEKTSLSPGPGMHKSSTTTTPRDSNSRTSFYENDSLRANGHHVRSASASSPFRSARAEGTASVSTTSSESSSDEEGPVPMKGPSNPSNTTFNRSKQQPRTKRPNLGAGAPQRAFFNPHVTVDQATDELMASDAAYSGPRRHSGIDIPTHKRADDPPEGFMEHRKKHEAAQSHQQEPSLFSGSGSTHFMQRPKSFDEHYRRPSQEETSRPSTAKKETPLMYDQGFQWNLNHLPKTSTATPSLRSQSTENIDLGFYPSGNPPKFGSGIDLPAPEFDFGGTAKHKVEDLDLGQTAKSADGQSDEQSPEKTPSAPPKGPACFFPNDWHQRAWAGTFQADSTRTQGRTSSQRRAGTPRASSLNNAKRAGTSRGNGLQPNVSGAADEPPTYNSATSDNLSSSSRVSSEGSAMDIDPVLTPPSGNDNQQQGHSNDVSPSRPDTPSKKWNQVPILPPRTAIPVQPEHDTLNLNLGDFKYVKPFGTSSEGLASVGDLSSALPFESRASSTRPQQEKAFQSLKMPNPPKAPSLPKPLNPTTWLSYINAMTAYMSNWSNFNNIILSHFHTRQEAQKQMNSGWMSAQGDGDYDAYMESLVEDEKVRKWWEVACDNHKECIDTLGKMRAAIKAETAKVKSFPYPS